MNLREARVRFTFLFATKLIPKAIELDFECAFDEITNHQEKGHMMGSLHYSGCAGDLLLYKDGVYQVKTEVYKELAEFWESLDENCKAGYRWGDGNHFSYSPFEVFGERK